MVNPERILVVKIADLGDALLTEPALRSLRAAYPNAELDYLTLPGTADLLPYLNESINVLTVRKDFLSGRPSVEDARRLKEWSGLGLRLRNRQYDLVLLLHHLTTSRGALQYRALATAIGCSNTYGLDNGRGTFLSHKVRDRGFGSRHEAEYMLQVARLAGGAEVAPRPTISTPSAMPPGIADVDSYAVLAPSTGSYAPAREWPLERFTEVARSVQDDLSLTPIIVGTSATKFAAREIRAIVPEAIDLTGETGIASLIALVTRANLAITNDSFVGHLASAAGTRVVAVFGPSNPHAWSPFGSTIWAATGELPNVQGISLWKGLPCSPCFYVGHRLGRRHGCPTRTCLAEIRVESVMEAARVVLGANK